MFTAMYYPLAEEFIFAAPHNVYCNGRNSVKAGGKNCLVPLRRTLGWVWEGGNNDKLASIISFKNKFIYLFIKILHTT